MDILYWLPWIIIALIGVAALLSWFLLHSLWSSLAVLIGGIILVALLFLVVLPWLFPLTFSQAASTQPPPATQSLTITSTVTVTFTPTPMVTPTFVSTHTTVPAIVPQATYTFLPTYTPYPTQVPPSATPVPPTAVPTVAAAMMPVVGNAQAEHLARLEQLDPVFRSQGLEAWLKAAGVIWDTLKADARQIEEETNPSSGKISASGIQVDAKNLRVNWPVIVTTDVSSRITSSRETVQFQPDARNGSTLYTNVVANGPVTVWIDGSNWGQFTSRLGMPTGSQPAVSPTVAATAAPTTVTTTSPKSTTTCLTIAQLNAKYGIDTEAQGTTNGLLYDKGVLSGAVLKLTQSQADELTRSGWVIQGTNPSVKSAWSPEGCRPLKQ